MSGKRGRRRSSGATALLIRGQQFGQFHVFYVDFYDALQLINIIQNWHKGNNKKKEREEGEREGERQTATDQAID